MTDRPARLAAALLLAASIAAPCVSAQGVEYAAGTTRYRVTTSTKGTQSALAGPSMTFEVQAMEQVTANLAKTARDTVKATVTLDTIALRSEGPVPDLSALKGASFVSMISPTGHFYSTKGPEGLNPALIQLVDGLGKFFPSYRANIARGYSWSDTVSGTVTQQGLLQDRTTISRYVVSGDTTIGSQKAWKVDRMMSMKATGSGTMQGTPVKMESDGTSNGVFFLSPNGIYLGSSSTDQINVKITLVGANMDVSIKSTVTTNVEPIQ